MLKNQLQAAAMAAQVAALAVTVSRTSRGVQALVMFGLRAGKLGCQQLPIPLQAVDMDLLSFTLAPSVDRQLGSSIILAAAAVGDAQVMWRTYVPHVQAVVALGHALARVR